MANLNKQHLKRNIGTVVLAILIVLIVLVAGFTAGFFPPNWGGSSPSSTPPQAAPLQNATSTQTPQPPTTSTPTPTPPPATSSTTSTSPIETSSNATSQTGYYLSNSRIFVVSSNSNYGYYPFATVTNPNGDGEILAENEEPCFIIDVTIRSDYSSRYPPPNPNSDDPGLVFVYLTAQIFSGGNQINATDITPEVGFVNGGAYAPLSSGGSATLTIYLATNNTDITSYQIASRFISGIAVP
jgi:hypothetical protein